MDFKFPDVGEGIAEGEIVKWHVKEGDKVKQDQTLAEIETDKAIVQMPSPCAGSIQKIMHKEGDTVKVGEVLVSILEEGAQKGATEKSDEKETKPLQKVSQQQKSVSVVGYLEEASDDDIQKNVPTEQKAPMQTSSISLTLATPAVRRLGRELNVDLATIKGTGLEGRVTEEDVRSVGSIGKEKEKTITKREYDLYGYIEKIPLKGVRKATAIRMAKSNQTIPHVTHIDEADVTLLVEHREREKKAAEQKGVHLTYMPFIVKACISALKEHPFLNGSTDHEHEEIILKKYYNIGIAVDTPDGLIVPVIKEADAKNIMQIAKEIEELAEKASSRTIDIADLKGNSFTITNIGVIGGLYATPIINQPDVAILAIGRIYIKPVFSDKKIEMRKVLPLSLSFDHRVLDGAEAARFMNDLKKYLEDPDLILISD